MADPVATLDVLERRVDRLVVAPTPRPINDMRPTKEKTVTTGMATVSDPSKGTN